MQREIIRSLRAYSVREEEMLLPPGAVVEGISIVRSSGPEPYQAEFRFGTRTLRCPLYAFLPRTRIVPGAQAETPGTLLSAAAGD